MKHAIAELLQQHAGDFLDLRVILDQQNGFAPSRRLPLCDLMFTDRAMAARHYPFFPQFLMRLSLDNLARASSLKAPLLVFHGSQDRIAPMAMGRAIAEAGRGELVEIAGAGHNETYDEGGDGYRDKMWSFLERHLSLPPLRP